MKKVLIVLSLISSQAFAQDKFQFSIAGGVKQNIFSIVNNEVAVVDPAPDYKQENIMPEVKNTTSFFVVMKTAKSISQRWTFTNTLGLDMQQLEILSGYKQQLGTPVYKQERTSRLLPRIKLDFGLEYLIHSTGKYSFAAGLSGGQMLNISKKGDNYSSSVGTTSHEPETGYSYSYVETTLKLYTRKAFFFISGSTSIDDVVLPYMESYYGNMGASVVYNNASYKIYEIGIGVAIQL